MCNVFLPLLCPNNKYLLIFHLTNKIIQKEILVWTFSPFSDLSYFLCLVLSSPVPAGCQCNGIL